MNVQFTGKIIAAEPFQQGTSQNGQQWCSQNYVIEELNQQYPSRAVFQVYGSDKLQQFGIQVGEILTAHIGLKARQSKEGRWFNQLDCWKVDRFGAQQTAQQQPAPQGYAQQGQVVQSQIGQQQSFPPQVNASGQPINRQPQGQAGGYGNLPFPPAQ